MPFSAADMIRYWKGELLPAQMHAMEKAALEDPFFAEALEGYRYYQRQAPGASATDLDALQEKLAARVGSETRPVAASPAKAPATKKPATVIPVLRRSSWTAAAAIAALLVLAAGFLWLWPDGRNKELAGKTDTTQKETVGKESPELSQPADSPVAASEKPSPEKPSADEAAAPANAPSGNQPATKPVAKPVPPSAKQDAEARPETAAVRSGEAARQEPVAVTSLPPVNAVPKPEQVEEIKIRGTVRNEKAEPVKGAVVQLLQGKLAGVQTLTDTNGRFQLDLPESDDTIGTLVVSSFGYDKELRPLSLSENIRNQEIALLLKPSEGTLNDVVVKGYGAKKKTSPGNKTDSNTKARENTDDEWKKLSVSAQQAIPLAGWDAYNRYLEQNRRVPDSLQQVHGNVVVSFRLNSKDKRYDLSIRQSLHPTLDAEAMRLVKEGPAWKILSGRHPLVYVIVPF